METHKESEKTQNRYLLWKCSLTSIALHFPTVIPPEIAAAAMGKNTPLHAKYIHLNMILKYEISIHVLTCSLELDLDLVLDLALVIHLRINIKFN